MGYKEDVLKNFVDRMKVISINEEYIYLQAKYGPSKIIRLPLSISEDLAFFVASIIGEGHLKKDKFITTIEVSNKKLLNHLSRISSQLFDVNPPIKRVKKRDKRKQTYHFTIYSKAVQELLNLVFEIPRGKKSNVVDVPNIILSENKGIQCSFIIGLLITEGSKKDRKKVRIASSSQNLLMNTQKMLNNLEIQSSIAKWIYKKYKKEFYELSFKRTDLNSLARGCRSGQTGQILNVFIKTLGDQA